MLPQVLPMLSVSAAPFDAADFVFEVKWDGVRALAAVDAHGWRLWGRGGSDYTSRYPEWAVLRQFPAGTLVDGELMVFRDGRADLARLLQRHQLVDALKIRHAPRWCPVHYVLFDLLYHAGRCLLHEPLARRRELLGGVCQEMAVPGIVFSAGVEGCGRAAYEAALAMGHEGVMAKAVASVYRPGQRSPAWKKFKPGWRSAVPSRRGRAAR
jgi:ATP-dependent DNA ligase